MNKIQKVKMYLFQNYLVLALDSQWIERFNGIPTFNVYLDKEGRLHLVTNEVSGLDFKTTIKI
jgi:hypothetical protein